MSTAGNQVGNQSNATGGSSAEELRKKTADMKQNVADLTATAKQAAGERLGELRDTANQYYEMGRTRVYDAEHTVEDYIRQQPLKSVLIAAGVGFLFGACYIRR